MSVAIQPTIAFRPKPTMAIPRTTTPSLKSKPALPRPTRPSDPISTATHHSKDTSSSSGKVFARPSKEYILPERAKPGRKVSIEEPDDRRQSQNRLSQRAHRARRTDYITTLEERLRQYEADEIHSNVRLQEVARALKADNERLKKEVAVWKGMTEGLKVDKEMWGTEQRRLEELVGKLHMQLQGKGGGEVGSLALPSLATTRPSTPMPTLLPNDPPTRRPTIDCPICPNPDPDCPCQQTSSHPSLTPTHRPVPLAALTLAAKAMAEHEHDSTSTCGLCQSTDECLCRVVDNSHDEMLDNKPTLPIPSPELDKRDGCGLCTSGDFCACKATSMSPLTTTSLGMGNRYPSPPRSTTTKVTTTTLSPAAVPLRLKRLGKMAERIWSIDPLEAVCSGDPSNCEACKNDSFGREFCENLFGKPSPIQPCTDRPGNCTSIKSLSCPSSTSSDIEDLPSTSARAVPDDATMTCDQAWKTLKAHPNSRFASLSLLADVVARRTNCLGPRVELSPCPDSRSASSTPLPAVSSVSDKAMQVARDNLEGKQVDILQAEQALGGKTQGKGTRKRTLAVETSAVRDALRLLDSTPGPGRPDPQVQLERDSKRMRVD